MLRHGQQSWRSETRATQRTVLRSPIIWSAKAGSREWVVIAI